MSFTVPGAPRFTHNTIPAIPTFPVNKPFVPNDYNRTDDFPFAPQGFEDGAAWPGAKIDPLDTIKRLRKDKNPYVAYDTQVIEYLVKSLQFFGEFASYKNGNESGEDDMDWSKLEDHIQFYRCQQLLEQWAAFKETTFTDPTMGRTLQSNQVRANIAPALGQAPLQQAALDIERRALVSIASGSGQRHRGRGRGRGAARGRGSTRAAATIAEA